MYINWTVSLERRLGRSSDQTQRSYARAKEALLEPTSQMLARAKENAIERRTQSLRSVTRHMLERRNSRSSEARTNSLERRKARSSQKPLLSDLTTKRSPCSIEEPWLERRTKTKNSLARITSRSREESKFWAAILCSQAQPTCYNLPIASPNSEIRN